MAVEIKQDIVVKRSNFWFTIYLILSLPLLCIPALLWKAGAEVTLDTRGMLDIKVGIINKQHQSINVKRDPNITIQTAIVTGKIGSATGLSADGVKRVYKIIKELKHDFNESQDFRNRG